MNFRTFAIVVFSFAILATGSVNAQEATTPRTSLRVWNDQFVSADGTFMDYSQYGYQVRIPTGILSGYGLLSAIPHEPLFTNHLTVYTPRVATWFSVHTEVGGNPVASGHFFQIGPRVNATNAIPWLKRPMDHLFITALPRFEGIRPNNLLVAGATNRFKITDNLQVSIEGYRRFFPRGGYYGEYWGLIHPKRTPRLSLGAFVANDSKEKVVVGFGGRIPLLNFGH